MDTLVIAQTRDAGGLPEASEHEPATSTSVNTVPASDGGMSHVSHMAIIEPNTTMPAEILQEDDTDHPGASEPTEADQPQEDQESGQGTTEERLAESTTVVAQSQDEAQTPAEAESQTKKPEAKGDGSEDTGPEGVIVLPEKRLDLDCPIPLTSDTVVVVGGKKCVLRVDPDSNHLVAYPFTPTPTPGTDIRILF